MPRTGRRVGLHGALLAAALGLLAAAPLVAEDTLIRRSGERLTGRLTACVGELCQWNGGAVRRAEIAWIGLGETGPPPPPGDPARDAAWLRDGRTIVGSIVGVSLGVVAIDDDSLDRPEVAWLYFGSAEGAPTAAPAAPAPPAEPVPAARPDRRPDVPPSAPPAVPTGEPRRPAPVLDPGRLILNEVSVLAAEGGGAFVELRNPGAERVALAGVALRNEKGVECALPAEAAVDAEGLFLVGIGNAVAEGARALCPADFLAAGTVLELVGAGTTWDRLEWGDSPAGLALRTRGGRISELRPGASSGRPPGGGDAAAWVRYGPAQATPGAANPMPAVDSFAALPGALFDRAAVPLTWYTVGGASRYRVQVASDPAFASPVVDRVVDAGGGRANAVARYLTDPLPDGTWYWRVKALGDAVEAPASEPQSFAVETAGEDAAPASGGGATAGASPNAENVTVVVGVPWIEQAKDTRLLALEADFESGPDPWDAPWENQPPYCARASIAMVNAFYRGRASQDRINYSAFHDWHPEGGPEIDLWIRTGLTTPRMKTAYEYAMGVPPSVRWLIPDDRWEEQYRTNLGSGMFIWQHVVDELDAARPVIGTSECHAWVYGGYRRRNGQLQLLVLDPAMGVYYFRPGVWRELTGWPATPAGEGLTEAFFVPRDGVVRAASDEATIASDHDGDGVMDFDEEVRFGTELGDDDSDGDGVPDKLEIRASVFERPGGWSLRARQSRAGQRFPMRRDTFRDLDGDGEAMELDADSDGGGCKDGEEDLDLDGRRDPGEPSNFDPADDPFVDGVCDYWTGTSTTRYWSRQADSWIEMTVEAGWRLRATRATVMQDPGPEHGGRNTGDPMLRMVDLSCEGTEMAVTWRQRYWGSSWVCDCTGEGSLTVGPQDQGLDGYVHTKVVDWDLTPILGYDVPREGGEYSIGCGAREGEPTFPLSCTCSDSGSWTSDAAFPPAAGIGLGNPLIEPRCNHDPEVRSLEGGGNRMVGTYSIHFPECAPQGADVTFSLCKAGTPCAPLPPLPGSGVAEPEEGAPPPR